MPEIARRDVFQALADPTRRKIIELVAKDPLNLNSIASQLKMTQPAISQQVKILNECGIVDLETIGRERLCKVRAEALVPAFLWLEKYQKQWTERIDSFEQYIKSLDKKNKSKKVKHKKNGK